MKPFRTLDLAIEFYGDVEKIRLVGNLRDQFLRAASSISLNLSEGNAKSSVKEKKRFYQTAYASLQECRTIIKLIKMDDCEISEKADVLGACLYKLMQSNLTSVIDARKS